MEFSSKLSFSLLFFFLLTISANAQDSPQDYLDAHNAARAQVGVPDLIWDDSVAAYAQNYANQRKNDCSLLLSGGSYGENIQTDTGDMSGAAAVNEWVTGSRYYDYNSNSCIGGDCREYTQVVWRSTIRLGCAKVRCYNGGTFIICNYDPTGNIPGERPY